MAKESWYINESELDDYQITVVRRSLQSSFIVKGSAGSGKTVLALWRAKELASSGEQDYLIIVFTKALKEFIADGVESVGLDKSKVMYHWEWKNLHHKKSADYIIVDEVQDFDADEINEFQTLARKHLILFGDSDQQLYKGLPDKGKLMSMEEIQIQTKIQMENLVLNHRLPKKIARVAQQISDSGDILETRCVKEGVEKPRLIKCKNQNAQLDYIMDVIKAQNYTDVGILFPRNADVQKAQNYLLKKGKTIEQKVGYGRASSNLNFHTTNPKLMTYHSAKGLQFEVVFLPFGDADSLPKWNGSNRNPFYVALTRTYRDLFVLYSNNLTPYIKDIHNYGNLFDIFEPQQTDLSTTTLPF